MSEKIFFDNNDIYKFFDPNSEFEIALPSFYTIIFKDAPPNASFNSSKEAEEYAKFWAKERGYTIIRGRAKYRVKS